MKKKKLKKIAKFIFDSVEKKQLRSSEIKETYESSLALSYDEETSNKISDFILNLITLDSKINLEVNENYINIYCNLSQFSNHSKGNTLTKDESLELNITDSSLRIRKDYGTYIVYKDSVTFNKLKPILLEKHQKNSNEELQKIINDVMIVTKLSRDSNLNILLD
jgi:hypothetical protein